MVKQTMKKIRNIKGFVSLTLIDYPGVISSIIFMGGCNLLCPTCHNKELVCNYDRMPDISIESIMDKLWDSRTMISGVCITGGEPTISSDIIPLIKILKRFGYKVKLDTNGLESGIVRTLVKSKLVDYVAVDVKTNLENYELLGCVPHRELELLETVEILKSQSKVDYEMRTTYFDKFVNPKTWEGIRDIVDGAKSYYIQAPNNIDLVKAIDFYHYMKRNCRVGKIGVRNFKGREIE